MPKNNNKRAPVNPQLVVEPSSSKGLWISISSFNQIRLSSLLRTPTMPKEINKGGSSSSSSSSELARCHASPYASTRVGSSSTRARGASSSYSSQHRRPPPPYSSSYSPYTGTGTSTSTSTSTSTTTTTKEDNMAMEESWDEICCPVSMEPPHNAVLLLCTSHHKGCRPFLCDTGRRHSNCFHHYKKAFLCTSNAAASSWLLMSCPLCRGEVTGCIAAEESAREYMNSKARSCSMESCGFSGCYEELREHARNEHPSARPSEADPDRERDWRRMEQEMQLGDVLSTMEYSDMGILEDGGGDIEEGEDDEWNRVLFAIFSMDFGFPYVW